MRCCLLLASFTAIAATALPTHGDFTIESSFKEISASATDFSGTDSFLFSGGVPLGEHTLVDNADSPGMWTYSGAADRTILSSSSIEAFGDVVGGGGVDGSDSFISAEAFFYITFSVEKEKRSYWDYFILEFPDSSASVSLMGPSGEVPIGEVYLEPGLYTITATASYTDVLVSAGDDTLYGRFQLSLENIPAPGTATLLGLAGLFFRSRRRN